MDLEKIELSLKKRLSYPYEWGRKQEDYFNGLTNFIYEIDDFDKLVETIKAKYTGRTDFNNLFNYALNRWYNFWSAQAVEQIFCSLPDVEPDTDKKNRLIDFRIKGITFDHKTSIFPKGYPGKFQDATKNPSDLIQWLYDNQSQQQRHHLKNRLFIVCHDKNGQHWKLKSELSLLRKMIENYVSNFDKNKLHQFSFEKDSVTLSDIVWLTN